MRATRSIQEVPLLLDNFFADLGQFLRRVVSKTSHYLVKLYAVFNLRRFSIWGAIFVMLCRDLVDSFQEVQLILEAKTGSFE